VPGPLQLVVTDGCQICLTFAVARSDLFKKSKCACCLLFCHLFANLFKLSDAMRVNRRGIFREVDVAVKAARLTV